MWWVAWAPGGFRATCYYYLKAYYRSYFRDPVACAMPESRRSYVGETAFPFILNNLHRPQRQGTPAAVLKFLPRIREDLITMKGSQPALSICGELALHCLLYPLMSF